MLNTPLKPVCLPKNETAKSKNLTKTVHDLEEEIARVGQMKTSFFGSKNAPNARKWRS
jgi:hypothetical protein